MEVWRWNLIPLAVPGLIVVVLAFLERSARGEQEERYCVSESKEGKRMSA